MYIRNNLNNTNPGNNAESVIFVMRITRIERNM